MGVAGANKDAEEKQQQGTRKNIKEYGWILDRENAKSKVCLVLWCLLMNQPHS